MQTGAVPFDPYLRRWNLVPDGEPIHTHSSDLLPVRHVGEAAILKMLSIYELEKAVYELRYELNNRPDWVRIPVAAIIRLLEAPLE